MKEAIENHWLIVGVTPKDSTEYLTHGIRNDHAFSIVSLAEVEDNFGQWAKIIKLRDPSGKIKWKGDWSDTSTKWSNELKDQLNFADDVGNSYYWLSYEDFIKFYGDVVICHYADGNEYSC